MAIAGNRFMRHNWAKFHVCWIFLPLFEYKIKLYTIKRTTKKYNWLTSTILTFRITNFFVSLKRFSENLEVLSIHPKPFNNNNLIYLFRKFKFSIRFYHFTCIVHEFMYRKPKFEKRHRDRNKLGLQNSIHVKLTLGT